MTCLGDVPFPLLCPQLFMTMSGHFQLNFDGYFGAFNSITNLWCSKDMIFFSWSLILSICHQPTILNDTFWGLRLLFNTIDFVTSCQPLEFIFILICNGAIESPSIKLIPTFIAFWMQFSYPRLHSILVYNIFYFIGLTRFKFYIECEWRHPKLNH